MLAASPASRPTRMSSTLLKSTARPFPTVSDTTPQLAVGTVPVAEKKDSAGNVITPASAPQDECICTTSTCGAGMLDAGAAVAAAAVGSAGSAPTYTPPTAAATPSTATVAAGSTVTLGDELEACRFQRRRAHLPVGHRERQQRRVPGRVHRRQRPGHRRGRRQRRRQADRHRPPPADCRRHDGGRHRDGRTGRQRRRRRRRGGRLPTRPWLWRWPWPECCCGREVGRPRSCTRAPRSGRGAQVFRRCRRARVESLRPGGVVPGRIGGPHLQVALHGPAPSARPPARRARRDGSTRRACARRRPPS